MAPTALKKTPVPTQDFVEGDDDDYYSRKSPKISKAPIGASSKSPVNKLVETSSSPTSDTKSSKPSSSPNNAPVKHGGVTYLMPIPSKSE